MMTAWKLFVEWKLVVQSEIMSQKRLAVQASKQLSGYLDQLWIPFNAWNYITDYQMIVCISGQFRILAAVFATWAGWTRLKIWLNYTNGLYSWSASSQSVCDVFPGEPEGSKMYRQGFEYVSDNKPSVISDMPYMSNEMMSFTVKRASSACASLRATPNTCGPVAQTAEPIDQILIVDDSPQLAASLPPERLQLLHAVLRCPGRERPRVPRRSLGPTQAAVAPRKRC